MSKLQFLIAENPLMPDQGIHILHCQWPQLLIRCIHRDDNPEYIIPDHPFWMEFEHQGLIGNEHIILCVGLIFNVNEITEAIPMQDDIAKVLKRAKRWYISYMNWEDQNIIDTEFNGQ